MNELTKRYTVIIYSENQIGLLSQISNIFTRRSLSIWSLSAGATAIEGIHSITIVTDGTRKRVQEAVMQLEKRVDVLKAYLYTDEEIVYKELALYKVPTSEVIDHGDIEDILARSNAKIVEINRDFAVIVKTGTTEETNTLYHELQKYGIMQFQRSGSIGVSRERQEPITDFLNRCELRRGKQNTTQE